MSIFYELLDDEGRVHKRMTRAEFMKDAGIEKESSLESYLRTLTLKHNSMYKGYHLCEYDENEENKGFESEKVDESKTNVWYVTRSGKIIRVDKRNNRKYEQKLIQAYGGYTVKINRKRKSLARLMYQKFVSPTIPKGMMLRFDGEPCLENLRVAKYNNGKKKKVGLVEDGKVVKTFDSITEAAKSCYISKTSAIRYANGQSASPIVNLVFL